MTDRDHATATRSDLHEAKRWKEPVRVASTVNISTSTPGATIDDVSMTAGDRVLRKDQTTASENGLWVWHGSASALTRATDASAATDMLAGDVVYVKEGTTNAGTNWQLTTSVAITLGTTSLAYTQMGGSEATASANTVKAGPTSGGAAAPAYRALVGADLPVFVASGASHVKGAVPDPGSTTGTSKFLREDATWAVPPVATTSTNQLAADVTMTSANTYYDGPSLTLTAGTYLLVGHVTCMITGNTGQYTAKLWDGTTVTDSAAQTQSSNTFPVSLSVCAVVTPTGSTTYKISVASGTAGGKILAAAPTNAAGNTASTLVATKLPV
jgi:hypothetical protein